MLPRRASAPRGRGSPWQSRRTPGRTGGAAGRARSVPSPTATAATRTTTDEVSLGLVPPRGWERVMHALSLVGACTTSPGHRLFKAKFRPRWESRYVVVRSFFDLPAAAVALFLVHHRPGRPEGSGSNELVGGPGFEPGTSRSRTERAAVLR